MHTDFRETISLRALREAPGHAEGKTKEIYAHAAKIGNDKGVRVRWMRWARRFED